MVTDSVRGLLAEADRANERRLLVLAGGHDATLAAAEEVLAASDLDPAATTVIGPRSIDGADRVPPERAGTLLGTTADAIVLDAHTGLDPDVLGRSVGAVTGGGLYVLCCPPLDVWPDRRDGFDDTLAVPPFTTADVAGRFRARFVETLRTHPGIAIVDIDAGEVRRDGRTHPAPAAPTDGPTVPAAVEFPKAAYEACRTQDQIDALGELEGLAEPGTTAVVEADRGRGKSSVAGLAAAAFAARGERVLVTAPTYRNAGPVFERAREVLGRTDALADTSGDPVRHLRTPGGGAVRFVDPGRLDADGPPVEADLLIVDEAAGLGVDRLTACLAVDRVAFVTTVHGYEGAGRGFSVRFRDRLTDSDHRVIDVRLDEPIRYAAGDPVEVWAFRALLLNAGPAPDQLLTDARPATVSYRRLDRDALVADEPLLREVFGLLVLAHYRTAPSDLARLLDAPNVSLHALLYDGHVASVALLAREGGLSADLRSEMYEGERVRGNMIPDVLTTQLRDETAGEPVGQRVMRIATHATARSRGLGSALLGRIRDRVASEVDWLGVGYGATPDLLDFWEANGYGTVHLSLTRNETSGEHSVVMLSPCSGAGTRLHDRHAEWFGDRTEATLADAHAEVDPALVRAVLGSVDLSREVELTPGEWRLVAGMAYGPGLVDIDPRPFRRLAMAHLIDPADPGLLTPREERLLIAKVLQGRPVRDTADRLGYPSRREALRALAAAYRSLTDAYGDEAAAAERDRYASQGADEP